MAGVRNFVLSIDCHLFDYFPFWYFSLKTYQHLFPLYKQDYRNFSSKHSRKYLTESSKEFL